MSARLAATAARPLLALFCGVLAACSAFDAKWRAAENPGPGVSRWEGRWMSEKHRALAGGPAGGKLRAVLTEQVSPAGSYLPPGPTPGGGRTLRADFRAHWLAFASSYAMTLTPVPGSATKFRGTHELPAIFGGTYRYSARVAGDQFTAFYDSSYDCGTFTLQRLRGPKVFRPPDSPH